MIDKVQLAAYARQLGLNLGQTEKNYLHIVTLHAVSRLFPDALIFKGGTALMLCHSLPRFSEDLDFNATKDVAKLLDTLKDFLRAQGIVLDIKLSQRSATSQSYIIRYQGPLYAGTQQTTAKIEMDISLREKVEIATTASRILHPYNDVPAFYIQTMNVQEILAEKIRAILTRQKARDVYDAEYLVAKNIGIHRELVNKKLAYYKKNLDDKELIAAVEAKRKLWSTELRSLVPLIPDFDEAKKRILASLTNDKPLR